MKYLLILIAILWASEGIAAPQQAVGVAACSTRQLKAYAPPKKEVAEHRQFNLPVIIYPFDAKPGMFWGLVLTARVDEQGRVVCYKLEGPLWDDKPEMNTRRRALVEQLDTWRYTPFARGGHPTAAIVVEHVDETEAPEKHVPLPTVPVGKVHIALQRSECFGPCPAYKVDIYGDGRVVYEGKSDVDVRGTHRYRVTREGVLRLITSLRSKDIWSLRSVYRTPVTDNPTYSLTIGLGREKHVLTDYVGQIAGMPSAVTAFEDEIDKVAQSDSWIHLSRRAVQQLKSEGFKFDSQAGADLLARAVANEDSHDDEATRLLVEWGTPLQSAKDGAEAQESLIENALRLHRTALIAPLIAHGALKTDGKDDQRKINAAFRFAIAGGRLASVQMLWNVAGDTSHPALSFDDPSLRDKSRKSPVTLLLSRSRGDDQWEGREVAEWLAAQGCDLKGAAENGNTLLHIAAEADDAAFVRYLLDQGLPASAPGRLQLPALGSTHNEDVAMMLLQAGGLAGMDGAERGFRLIAEENHWDRVITWLKSHASAQTRAADYGTK